MVNVGVGLGKIATDLFSWIMLVNVPSTESKNGLLWPSVKSDLILKIEPLPPRIPVIESALALTAQVLDP